MARHGENIRKRKDGRWEGRYPVYSEEKGKKIYCSVYGRTYEEVREKLTTKKNLLKSQTADTQKIIEGRTYVLKEIIFTDAAQGWLAQVREKRKPSTYVKYKLVYQKHLENIFENNVLSEMTDSFVRDKLSDSLSESVIKSIYCVLNQILKYASIQYSLIITPLKRPVPETRQKQVKVLSKNEQKRLMAVLYHEMNHFKMAVLLVLFTGLRLGELCALK